MASTALILVAVAALTAGAAGGAVAYIDLEEFELSIEVHDALTDEALAGANVEIRDANGLLVAQGVTDEDGEYAISMDDHDTEDTDAQADEDAAEIEAEDNASLGAVASPLTVMISKMGYDTQTFSVKIDTWDDDTIEVKLVPSG
jgi:hypothetical protein